MLSPYLLLVLPMMVPFCIRAFPTTQIDETKPEQNENFPRPNIQDPPPTLVEGDIVKNEQTTIQVRMSVADRQMTWTGRQIPYIFNQGDYNSAEKMIIRNALKELQRLVSNCVQFYETPTPRKDYIVIKNSHGCYSSVGRIGGAQTVSLSTDGCLNRQGTIFHEMMHALGFWHEHNRPDRDSHIAINYANIDRNHWLDFDKLKDEEVDTLSQPYDLTSVMHYNQWTFSKFPNDRNKTSFSLLDKVSDRSLIGQRSNLSAIDINKIKTLYKCGIKQCSYPGSLENGMINELHYMEESPVGTWISYNCIQGFVLIGPSRRMCKYNGTWTGFKPECVNSNQGIIKYCSFEQDMCGWRQDSNDDFDWTRTNKRTETEMTGPTVDNTYEGSGGYFIYMESSSPKTVGYKTRLISPDIVPKYTNHTIKVKLFYHMFGDTMGTLNIYLNITTHMGEKQETLASLKKAEGNVWHMKEFSYNSTYHTSNDKVVKYNIILEGVVGPGYHSDIGIDDIIVREVQMTEMQVKVLQLPGGYYKYNSPFQPKFKYNLHNIDFHNYLRQMKYHGLRNPFL